MLPIVELRDVTLSIDGKSAFPRTSWTIAPGEHWAIVGPNGSGKSTLARALTGEAEILSGRILHPQAGGDATVDPLFGNTMDGYIRFVSFRDQAGVVGRYSTYLQGRYESLEGDDAPTAAEFLNMTNERMGDVLSCLDLDVLLARKIIHLSNGEMRKLLLARAICRVPRLLILDEPFMGLDCRSREELSGLLERASRLGVALVVVTSRFKDIPEPVTNVLRVSNRRIVERGKRADMTASGLAQTTPKSPPTTGGMRRPEPRRPIVRLQNVTVSYDGVHVLDRVTWVMRSGENWTLAGLNGAGKTTLLSLILADNPQAYANDVWVFGHKRGDGTSIWDLKRRIGHVSPELQIHFIADATVLDTICSGFSEGINLRAPRTTRQISRSRTIAESLGLGSLLEERFATLSDGHKRLALIARAFVKGPSLVVLDEPCLGLDDAHREAVRTAVDTLCAGGRHSIVFVTHDAEDIPSCVTHLLRLEGGRVIFCGSRETAPAGKAE